MVQLDHLPSGICHSWSEVVNVCPTECSAFLSYAGAGYGPAPTQTHNHMKPEVLTEGRKVGKGARKSKGRKSDHAMLLGAFELVSRGNRVVWVVFPCVLAHVAPMR